LFEIAMNRPVLVTPPAILPVSLAEAKAHLLVEHDDDDAVIEAYIGAAVDHLDGWTGILGRCLVEQEWRQDYEAFAPCLPLPLGPVISIMEVAYIDDAGVSATVDPAGYALRVDAGGRARVEFKAGAWFGTPVSVIYKAGHPNTSDDGLKSTVPAAIKVAIMLMVGNWHQSREAATERPLTELPIGAHALLAPYRRIGV
jgi:uncharacterized phiE125 gp8 family phage protein